MHEACEQAERDRRHQEEQRRNRGIFHLIRLSRGGLWRQRRLAAGASSDDKVSGPAASAEESYQLPRIVPSRLVSTI